ncbi:MAG: hypothetical protein ACYC7A_21005 [Thermoanaerobaculia bacterium]
MILADPLHRERFLQELSREVAVDPSFSVYVTGSNTEHRFSDLDLLVLFGAPRMSMYEQVRVVAGALQRAKVAVTAAGIIEVVYFTSVRTFVHAHVVAARQILPVHLVLARDLRSIALAEPDPIAKGLLGGAKLLIGQHRFTAAIGAGELSPAIALMEALLLETALLWQMSLVTDLNFWYRCRYIAKCIRWTADSELRSTAEKLLLRLDEGLNCDSPRAGNAILDELFGLVAQLRYRHTAGDEPTKAE